MTSEVNCTFPTRHADRRPWLLLLSALILLLDRLTKHWVSRHISEGDDIVIIRHVFRISHVRNPGAGEGMFDLTKADVTTALRRGARTVDEYLGLLDVAYNVRHGQYSTTRGFLDAAVNLACLVFGAVNIRFGLGSE